MYWVSHIIAAEFVNDRTEELSRMQSRPRPEKSRRVSNDKATAGARPRRVAAPLPQPSTKVAG